MFAALTVARLREACAAANLLGVKSWQSPDEVDPAELPLAKACEKVLASMQAVLEKTMAERDRELGGRGMAGELGVMEKEKKSEKRMHLRKTKAAEVRVVRNLDDLKFPGDSFKAVAL